MGGLVDHVFAFRTYQNKGTRGDTGIIAFREYAPARCQSRMYFAAVRPFHVDNRPEWRGLAGQGECLRHVLPVQWRKPFPVTSDMPGIYLP